MTRYQKNDGSRYKNFELKDGIVRETEEVDPTSLGEIDQKPDNSKS